MKHAISVLLGLAQKIRYSFLEEKCYPNFPIVHFIILALRIHFPLFCVDAKIGILTRGGLLNQLDHCRLRSHIKPRSLSGKFFPLDCCVIFSFTLNVILWTALSVCELRQIFERSFKPPPSAFINLTTGRKKTFTSFYQLTVFENLSLPLHWPLQSVCWVQQFLGTWQTLALMLKEKQQVA